MTRDSLLACRLGCLVRRAATPCLLTAVLVLSGCASGTKPMAAPAPRYQENLLVKCPTQFPALPSDEIDEAVRNHVSTIAEARECARRHNNLVDAIRGSLDYE